MHKKHPQMSEILKLLNKNFQNVLQENQNLYNLKEKREKRRYGKLQ